MPVVTVEGPWRKAEVRGRIKRAISAVVTVALIGSGAVGGSLMAAAPATADTAPVAPATRSTVSADALPTVQVNGVVWAQIVVGDTVYATGQFTSARPPGAAPGTVGVARSNILAYDIRTGQLLTSWAPTLDAQGLALAASADGKQIFVGGDFTNVSGVVRNRIVALDAATGDVVTEFKASVNTRVRALAVGDGVLYAGGLFTTSSGQPRGRLAAFSSTTGALLDWAPEADREVLAITVPAGSGKVVIGGRFSTLGGADNYGLGAVSAETGAAIAWPANSVIRNAGSNAAINSLSNDGTQVYGTGYTFGTGGNLENTFATDTSGKLLWVSGCRGDTYSNAPIGGVLYSVSHSHDCSALGAWGETDPQSFQRALAVSTTGGAHGERNLSGAFINRRAPELLHWLPSLSVGSYTGQFQAAWSVAGNSKYVVLGGEFLAVNGTTQQGLTRFAVKSVTTNKQGPLNAAELVPSAKRIRTGAVRVSWKASWDRDNRRLTYEVLRGSTVIGSIKADSTWWDRPTVSFTDTTAPAKTAISYRIRVSDGSNVITGPAKSFTGPPTRRAVEPYATKVRLDGVTEYWRLGEASGTAGYNWSSNRDLTLASTSARGRATAIKGGIDPATAFAGGTKGVSATTSVKQAAPQVFSEELWFYTSSKQGGRLIGFGTSNTADSGTADRQIYISNNGRLNFGVLSNGTARTISSKTGFNNGKWHHVVATLGNAGMQLYVDGKVVATRTTTTYAETYSGYWRVAGGPIATTFRYRPTRTQLAGTIDEVAVYPRVLTVKQVAAHWKLGGH